ncbi:MAG: hypothetical protein L6V93_01065 [Clostridiales bacterium]|nr:MAG: hypothetical protein L6V93_01065 [Clostridiales bacterium]
MIFAKGSLLNFWRRRFLCGADVSALSVSAKARCLSTFIRVTFCLKKRVAAPFYGEHHEDYDGNMRH